MAFTQQFNTNALLTLLNQSVAGGGPITITSVQVGSGFPAPSDKPENYTGLKNPVSTLTAITSPSKLSGITSINAQVLYQSTVRFQVSSADAPLTYQWNEYGVFAKLGSGSPVLIAYVTTGAATGDTITPSGTGIPIVKQNATIINYSLNATTTTNLTLVNTVDLHAGTHLDNGTDPIPIATASRTGLLPVLKGALPWYLDGTGNWSPITPLIVNNTTLYVNPTYNNVTPNFSSIANAMNYLNGFNIANGISVNILVADAVYPTPASLNIQHLNGQQINILAQNAAADISFSGVGSVTGSAYNWAVQLTGVSSVSNVKVGTYLNIWSTGGVVGGFLLTGCYRVTAVSGNTVTIQIPYRGASFPAIAGTSGWMSPLNVILNLSKNQSVYIGNHGVALLRQIAIACAGAPSTAQGFTALNITGPAFLDRVGVNGFIPSAGWTTDGEYVGIGLAYGSGTAYKCCSSGNGVGFVSDGNASWNTIWCAGCNNTFRGYWAQGGQFIGCFDYVTPGANASSWACGNNENGLAINAGSILVGQAGWENGVEVYGSWITYYNGSWGVAVGEKSATISSRNSDLSGANGDYIWSANNTNGDLAVTGISIADLQVIGSRIFNQATGVFNANGVINV